MTDRRGGLRIDPLKQPPEAVEQQIKRRSATTVRGVATLPDGTVDTHDWHEVGASGEPAFQNSWVNFTAGNATAAYRRYGNGMVEIKGMVKSGTIGQKIFDLPAGFRPAADRNFAVPSNDAFGRLEVRSNGAVFPAVGNNAWFVIDCQFAAEA